MLAGRTKPTRQPPPRDPVRQLRAAIDQSDWPSAADWAVTIGHKSREYLPAELVPGFDAVQNAFRQYESGQGDLARNALGQIGLASPFLEWKLLLRGLLAYVAGDDGLALDNWKRLHADRLPAKAAAPLRASLDAGYRAAQPLARQQVLQSAADKLRGGHVADLRKIQATMGRPEFLARALEQIGRLLPRLRRESPELIPKLARACYAAATHGHPDGAAMLKSLFDPPTDDPTWSRLPALAAEMRGEWMEANRHWQHYQSVLSEHTGFPGDDRARARAMIWVRCAHNARQHILDFPRGPKPSPDAEGCYRRAIQLDPELVEATAGLFDLYGETNRTQQALAVGRRLLELSPDHPDIHLRLADLARAEKNLDLAVEHLHRAREANPFDRDLGSLSARSLRQRARNKASAGDLAGAQADLRAVETPTDRLPTMLLSCQQAILAYKLGDRESGDRLADEARGLSPAGAAWALLAEATHSKLPKPARSQFEWAWRSALSDKPVADAAADLAETAIDLEAAPPFYRGYKSHLKSVQDFIDRSICYAAPAVEFQRLCDALLRLSWWKLLKHLSLHGEYKFPKEPVFLYFGARANIDNPKSQLVGYAASQLQQARALAENRSKSDPSMNDLLRKIAEAERRCWDADRDWRLPDLLELFNV